MDPHHFGNLDPHPHQIKIQIRIRIKAISWIRNRIRIRINLQMTSQNVRNMSLFEHFFKGWAFIIWKLGFGSGSGSEKLDLDPGQDDKSYPDPQQRDADSHHSQHWLKMKKLWPAKSPSSCGNSSHMTATLTEIPVRMDSEKAAPMLSPSMKLCIPSPKMIIQATVAMVLPPPGPSRDFTFSTVGRPWGAVLRIHDLSGVDPDPRIHASD